MQNATADDDDNTNTGNKQNEMDALEDIDVLLDQTRPRHLVEGLTSGIGYIVAGAIGAAGILVLSPQVGSQTGYEKGNNSVWGGIVGGVVGAGVGVGSAVSVAAGGVLTGVGQILRGLANTPQSIIEPRRGKWWSTYEGKWAKTHLKSEQEWIDTQAEFDEDLLGDDVVPTDILMQRSDKVNAQARADQYGVHDTELYDIMGVEPDATSEELKRRYNQVGKLFSPSRQGADNPTARARYQQIGNAFVILTNAAMRERYDKYGMDGIYGIDDDNNERQKRELVNPAKLYNVMYGSDRFSNYIGRLAATAEASVGIQKSSKITLVEARLLQKRRVTRLALSLAQRLKKWTKGAEAEALSDWEKEAEYLCDAHHGKQLVHLIGAAYSLSAVQFLGSLDSGIGMPSIRGWAHGQAVTLLHNSKKSAKKVETFAGDVKKINVQHEAKQRIEESGLVSPHDSVTTELFDAIGHDVLEMLWTRTAVDVTNTIHEAAQMVLFDQDLNDETRKLRGLGLEALGNVFQKAEYGQSRETEESQADYERVAFYAVLDTIRKQEIASRNADTK